MQTLTMFILGLVLVTILSRIRIVRKETPAPIEKNWEIDQDTIRILGDFEFIREKNPTFNDVQILADCTERFRRIFITGMTVVNENPEKVDEFFDIRVYKALNNSNTLVSEAKAKNDTAIMILKGLRTQLEG